MKTKCLIQKSFCPNGYNHCCMECDYEKQHVCNDNCLNHVSKCGLCVFIKDDGVIDEGKDMFE